jgi:hypothetical protein
MRGGVCRRNPTSFCELLAGQRCCEKRITKMIAGEIPVSQTMRYPFDIAVTYALLLLVMCCVVNLTLS